MMDRHPSHRAVSVCPLPWIWVGGPCDCPDQWSAVMLCAFRVQVRKRTALCLVLIHILSLPLNTCPWAPAATLRGSGATGRATCPQPVPAASVGLQVMPSRPHLMVWTQTVPTTLCLRAGPRTPTEIINDYCCFKPLHFRVICCAATDKNTCLESCDPCASLGQALSARVGTAG